MKRAGFIQKNGNAAIDDEGRPWEILEITIYGSHFAIRADELRAALNGKIAARVERITRNWTASFGGVAGIAERSRSRRALNIELVSGDRFTLSMDALCALFRQEVSYVGLAQIPSRQLDVRTGGQQTIPAFG